VDFTVDFGHVPLVSFILAFTLNTFSHLLLYSFLIYPPVLFPPRNGCGVDVIAEVALRDSGGLWRRLAFAGSKRAGAGLGRASLVKW